MLIDCWLALIFIELGGFGLVLACDRRSSRIYGPVLIFIILSEGSTSRWSRLVDVTVSLLLLEMELLLDVKRVLVGYFFILRAWGHSVFQRAFLAEYSSLTVQFPFLFLRLIKMPLFQFLVLLPVNLLQEHSTFIEIFS